MKPFGEILKCGRIIGARKAEDGFVAEIHLPRWKGSIVASNGCGWDHVSVSPYKKQIVPSWDDMCMIKDLCFEPEEWVVQFHPAQSEYVNNMPNCLHLWRPNDGREMPTPPAILTGLKGVVPWNPRKRLKL